MSTRQPMLENKFYSRLTLSFDRESRKSMVKQSFEMSNILRGQDFSWIFLRKKRVIHDKTKSRQNSVNHVSWRYMKAFKR